MKKGDNISYASHHTDPWHYIWVSFDGDFAENFAHFDTVGNISPEIFMNLMSAFEKEKYTEEYVISQIYLLYIQLSDSHDIKTTPEKKIIYTQTIRINFR